MKYFISKAAMTVVTPKKESKMPPAVELTLELQDGSDLKPAVTLVLPMLAIENMLAMLTNAQAELEKYSGGKIITLNKPGGIITPEDIANDDF